MTERKLVACLLLTECATDGMRWQESRAMTVRWMNYLWEEPHPATPDEIGVLEHEWDVLLPDEFKRIISTRQGMTPEFPVFDVDQGTDVFNTLLTIHEEEKWQEYSARRVFEALKPHVPTGIFPFADTPGGQYICFDYRNTPAQPTIVLVTVEMDIYPIANSFSEFLEMLHD
ncbi:SMI1/KNR4 family protein [Archangium violaceum]|uniref:SMI1/KNR4 family protein n=1 Tax=Archangium violaceum TaxID=83451 RepID=UPI001362FB72|nr:SMI1/KNR4 family protein [Archangium violaceum]